MKLLITGAGGQLGTELCWFLKNNGIEYCGRTSKELDVCNEQAVMDCVESYRPDGVIHCAAYTQVDRAEDERQRCWSVNVDGSRNIALACEKVGAKLLYLSTDYVFSGSGNLPHLTTDPVSPLNVYGAAKLGGELAIRTLMERYFIVRISWVFGINGNNFLKTMLRLGQERKELSVVCDQIGSPTYTADLAPLLCKLICTEEYGVYHASNEGECSWAEFAQEIFNQAHMAVTVNPIPTSQYPTKAVRPLNSRLDKSSLERANLQKLPPWQTAVANCVRELTNET